jgi:hypothetical protein
MSTPEITVNGTSGAYEQPQRFGVDSTGPYCIRTWRGTASAIATQYNTCVASGALAEVQAGFGTHTVTARYPLTIGGAGGTETPIDTWEFFASAVEKDFMQADIAAIEAMNDADKYQLENLIANPPATPADVPAWNTTLGADLYTMYRAGVRSVLQNAPALRHTQTVSNQYTVAASLTNVGKILSTSTLVTAESLPSGVLFNMPIDVSTRSASSLVYAWFKHHPTVRAAARQKMQIEQEWVYGLWSTILYGAAL